MRQVLLASCLSALIPGLSVARPALPQAHAVKASPFDGLRWPEAEGEAEPEVRIGDVWYRPLAVDGLAVADVLAACDRRWPGQRRKRFGEDLVEAMVLLGWDGDLRVDLDLERMADGERVRLEDVEMTMAKREAIRRGAAAHDDRRQRTAPAAVPRAAALRDLEVFEAGLRQRFAYLSLRGVDLGREVQRIRANLGETVDVRALAGALHRVLMRFGDGHAEVRAPLPDERDGDLFLSFLLVEAAEGIVAVKPDRSGLVQPQLPVVKAFDGRELSAWIAAVTPDIAAGSPQLVRHRALRALRAIDVARRALGGKAPGAPLEVTFTDGHGRQETRTLELSRRRPIYGAWPRGRSRELEGDVGYLRIPQMDEDVDALRAAMRSFRDTRGLVVDVRGNGGGSRDLLLALAGYLIGPGEPAVVANVAAYRLADAFSDDHLEARFLRRADWPDWSPRQRAAIAASARQFHPEWTPREEVSAWHYLVLDRTGHTEEYHYDAPVVVLSDAGCFSATDIFLGALALMPRVTLVGTASSGGSARSQAFALPNTGIQVRCASMVSFRPDGRLYDGRGVEVDEEVLPNASDFATSGGDAQLDRAMRILKAGSR